MRQKQQIQPCLCGPWADHPLAEEMAVMAAILDAHPVIAELAWQDLTDGRRADIGAPGMEAMAAVKAALLQKLLRLPYQRLAFHLSYSERRPRFVGQLAGLLKVEGVHVDAAASVVQVLAAPQYASSRVFPSRLE